MFVKFSCQILRSNSGFIFSAVKFQKQKRSNSHSKTATVKFCTACPSNFGKTPRHCGQILPLAQPFPSNSAPQIQQFTQNQFYTKIQCKLSYFFNVLVKFRIITPKEIAVKFLCILSFLFCSSCIGKPCPYFSSFLCRVVPYPA